MKKQIFCLFMIVLLMGVFSAAPAHSQLEFSFNNLNLRCGADFTANDFTLEVDDILLYDTVSQEGTLLQNLLWGLDLNTGNFNFQGSGQALPRTDCDWTVGGDFEHVTLTFNDIAPQIGFCWDVDPANGNLIFQGLAVCAPAPGEPTSDVTVCGKDLLNNPYPDFNAWIGGTSMSQPDASGCAALIGAPGGTTNSLKVFWQDSLTGRTMISEAPQTTINVPIPDGLPPEYTVIVANGSTVGVEKHLEVQVPAFAGFPDGVIVSNVIAPPRTLGSLTDYPFTLVIPQAGTGQEAIITSRQVPGRYFITVLGDNLPGSDVNVMVFTGEFQNASINAPEFSSIVNPNQWVAAAFDVADEQLTGGASCVEEDCWNLIVFP